MSSNINFYLEREVYTMQTQITISFLDYCSSLLLLKENQGEVLVNWDSTQAQPLASSVLSKPFYSLDLTS